MCNTVSDPPPGEASALHSRRNDPTRTSTNRPRTLARSAPVLIVLVALAALFFAKNPSFWFDSGVLPQDPREAANVILSKAPVIVR
jgi:hypothetical protein